jgi:hypothetical protein
MFGPQGNAVHDRPAGCFRYVQDAACQSELVMRTKRKRSRCAAILRAPERTPRNYEWSKWHDQG